MWRPQEEFAWDYGLLDVVLSIEFRGMSKRGRREKRGGEWRTERVEMVDLCLKGK